MYVCADSPTRVASIQRTRSNNKTNKKETRAGRLIPIFTHARMCGLAYLGDAPQCELLHQVDFVGVLDVLVLSRLKCGGVGCVVMICGGVRWDGVYVQRESERLPVSVSRVLRFDRVRAPRTLKVLTATGKVAEKRPICRFGAQWLRSCSRMGCGVCGVGGFRVRGGEDCGVKGDG